MVNLLITLAFIAAILLILIVLVQKPKGGGITASLTGANQIFGVRGTSNLVEKITWGLSAFIALVLLVTSGFNKPFSADTQSEIEASEEINKALENAPSTISKPQNSAPFPIQGQDELMDADQPEAPAE